VSHPNGHEHTDSYPDEVKDLLGRAFAHEPPLALDRAEVFRSGRRQVARRRVAASSAVAASVIVAVAGVASLMNAMGGQSRDVAASSSTAAAPTTTATTETAATSATGVTAPPGPSLPLTVTTPLPAAEVHAETLTGALAGDIVLSGFQLGSTGDGARLPLVFVYDTYTYTYTASADLTDEHGVGTLVVRVGRSTANAVLLCENSTAEVRVSCQVDSRYGYPVAVTSRAARTGTIEYSVRASRGDGTDVLVTATNMASRGDRPVTRGAPPLDLETLRRLASNPYLTYA
jgi:hypothetical protein